MAVEHITIILLIYYTSETNKWQDNVPLHIVTALYLSLEEQLITGKNMPSKLKFLNDPFTVCPLNVNVMTGTVKSSAQPITSPFLM